MLTIDCDISEPTTIDRIISGALERFGRIDTLVNNAGIYISTDSVSSSRGFSAQLLHRHHVAQRLRRVELISQAVPDGYTCVLRE